MLAVSHFGEIYVFSPLFIAVRREEPTQVSFWNLQPDDEHDFMLVALERAGHRKDAADGDRMGPLR